jgi:hypothetical protein
MRGRRTALLLTIVSSLAVAVQACAARDPQPAARPQAQRYQTTATVLQDTTHGPELCLSGVAQSLPPQCGGVPVTNWRWDQVDGERSVNGTTWGTYRLVGTYDGTSFTAAETGAPEHQPPPTAEERFEDEPKTPCREPAGGWKVPDPARRSERYLEPVSNAAKVEPDFAGLWLSYLEPMGGNVAEDPGEFVLNAAFTGDLARHEAELRPLWGGRLCVTRLQRTLDELSRIQDELMSGDVAKRLGLQVLTAGVDQVANRVNARVVVLPDEAQATIDRRYGSGVVDLSAVLLPVG